MYKEKETPKMTCYMCDKKCDCLKWAKIHVGKLCVDAGVCKECAAKMEQEQ